jgi:hypothetical protein
MRCGFYMMYMLCYIATNDAIRVLLKHTPHIRRKINYEMRIGCQGNPSGQQMLLCVCRHSIDLCQYNMYMDRCSCVFSFFLAASACWSFYVTSSDACDLADHQETSCGVRGI